MMDFDRAMNVRVNGKEVNRFAINGVTIWEKYTPASILLTSDKSYASEGDTINLTATVNDKFNRPCPNKNVDFYICDQLIQSVEEPYEATRDAKYFLSEGDFTNKSIEFTVDAISGSIDILCEAATIRPFFRMTGLQVGDIVKITDDGTFVKGYVNDTLTYTANHINNPGMIGFSLPNGATLTFSHFTEKGDVLIDSDMTDDTGVASVSYLVQGSEPLSIKAKCGIILSEIYRVYINKDLTSYLISTSDYVAKDSPVNGVSAGSVSKLSVSNNIATLSATAHVWHTQEFTEKQDYILMFDVVNAGYPGYDWGFYIGDSKDACVGVNFQYSQAKFIPSGNISFNTRYTSYVPVIITRHNENWNININNGQINQDFTYTGEILNKLSMVKFSGGNMSIKNLKIII